MARSDGEGRSPPKAEICRATKPTRTASPASVATRTRLRWRWRRDATDSSALGAAKKAVRPFDNRSIHHLPVDAFGISIAGDSEDALSPIDSRRIGVKRPRDWRDLKGMNGQLSGEAEVYGVARVSEGG